MLSFVLVASLALAEPFVVGPTGDEPASDPGRSDPDPAPGAEPDADSPDAVVGGVETDGFPDVVALAVIDEFGRATVFCSGTLIADTWVLTAAHCVNSGIPTALMSVLWGGDIAGTGYDHAVRVRATFPNPAYDPNLATGDVAVVELFEPRDGAVPMVLNDAPLDDEWLGVPLTFVGFGVTSDLAADSGTKRTADIPVQGFDVSNVSSFATGKNVCFGDSGGPAFVETERGWEIVGVNAFVTPGCVGGGNGATRVDAHLGFILDRVPFALLEPPPEPPPGVGQDEVLDFGIPGDAGLRDWPLATGTGGGCATAPSASFGWLVLLVAAWGSRSGPTRHGAGPSRRP